jgi:nitroreductase
VREYKTEVVDEKTIRDLIEAAVLSPNAVSVAK